MADEPDISLRATAIARGLIKTQRARIISMDQGILRLECLSGGYYWITLDGRSVLRGNALLEADELQPKFIDAMEKAGRPVSDRSAKLRGAWPT